jgi:2-polyprenyl-6-hydroxyphenyl methylase/3-demethylubiquinone-9 3-methyltransferase
MLRQEIGQDSHNNSSPLHEISVLDVGCGGGILSESMAILGATVHGIDVVEKNIAIARHHAQESKLVIDYDVTTSSTLVQRKQSYDAVLCMEVVEHVPDIVPLMRDCMRLVRPGEVYSF